MPGQFLHGVEIVEINDGIRPITTSSSSVIGVVGTAPDADPLLFPLDTPVLVAGSRLEAARLDTIGNKTGTLPAALDGILDQVGAVVVVIRVAEVAAAGVVDVAATTANVIGGVDAVTGAYLGVQALLAAESVLGVPPRILIATGFSDQQAVVAELLGVADKLRAVIITDGPNTNDADAINYRNFFGSRRVYVVDPFVSVFDTVTASVVQQPASARVAGVLARTDQVDGFWHSPSNRQIYGIVGTARAIDFQLGNASSRANLLNASEVGTIIQQQGYRLWGNRTTSADPKWAFISVVRTADLISDSLQKAHLWAVDRNITRTYVQGVTDGVQAYLDHLKAQGAILGGKVWADKTLNTPTAIQNGEVFFDFDFTPPYPAEHITFRSHMVNDYVTEVFK